MTGRRAAFGGLLFLCLIVRWTACYQTRLVSTDGAAFFFMAQEIAGGEWRSALAQDQHPLYPSWLALFYGATGHPGWTFVASMTALSALLFLFLWRLAERLFDAETAAWSAFLYAVHPLFIRNAADFLSETPALTLMAAGLLILVRWCEEPALARAAALGGVAGLGYLVRQESVEVLLGAALVLAWRWGRGRLSLHRAAGALALAAAVFLLVIGPYLLHLRAEEGRWMISRKKGFFALFPWLDPEYEVHPEVPPGGEGMILAVRVWIHRLDFWYGLQKSLVGAFHPLLLALVAAGFWVRRKEPPVRRAPAWILAAFLALHVAILLVLYNGAGYLEKRHVLFAVLVSCPWGGAFLAWTARRWGWRGGARLGAGACLAALFLVPALKPRRDDYGGRGIYRETGIGIARSPAAPRVLAAPRGRAGQWIAYSAVLAGRGAGGRPDRMILYEGEGRLELGPATLVRADGILLTPELRERYGELLSGWRLAERWEIVLGEGEREVWLLVVRPEGK